MPFHPGQIPAAAGAGLTGHRAREITAGQAEPGVPRVQATIQWATLHASLVTAFAACANAHYDDPARQQLLERQRAEIEASLRQMEAASPLAVSRNLLGEVSASVLGAPTSRPRTAYMAEGSAAATAALFAAAGGADMGASGQQPRE